MESYEALYKLCEEAIFACGGVPVKLLEADNMSEVDDESVLQPLLLDGVKLFCKNFNSAHTRNNKPGIQLPYGKALRIITDYTVSENLSKHLDRVTESSTIYGGVPVKAGSLLPKQVLPLSRHLLPRTLAISTVEFWQLLQDLDLEKFGEAIAAYGESDGSYVEIANMVMNPDPSDPEGDEIKELLDFCVDNFPKVWGYDVSRDEWKAVLDTIVERGEGASLSLSLSLSLSVSLPLCVCLWEQFWFFILAVWVNRLSCR